jgi:hypothetical protein
MIDVRIAGGKNGRIAGVSERGALFTSDLEFAEFYTANATVINTGYNIVVPQTNKKFVITAMIISANRDVSATNGAVVDIYEALDVASTTVTKQIYQDEITKLDRAIITGLNVLVNEGRWLNLKTDDNSVRVNLTGYYIDADGFDDDSRNRIT